MMIIITIIIISTYKFVFYFKPTIQNPGSQNSLGAVLLARRGRRAAVRAGALYTYIYIYMYVCIYIYIYMYIYIYICAYLYIYI